MESWQNSLLYFFAIFNFGVFLKGFHESNKEKNAFETTPFLLPLGIIVWGDAVAFGLFWIIVGIIVLILQDWILFLLIFSVFWVVRSLGETIYWFNQQFSQIVRNPPKTLPFYKYFHNDSIWFVHQIIWQCITVVSVIFSIYFAKLWL